MTQTKSLQAQAQAGLQQARAVGASVGRSMGASASVGGRRRTRRHR
jgi:hypothetical protein